MIRPQFVRAAVSVEWEEPMTGERHVDGTATQEGGPEPANVVAAMASAVERVRSMATTVFEGDADLFGDAAERN